MTTPLEVAGARSTTPTQYAPIFTNRFWTGLWTQRSPLRDAATPYLYEKFYSGNRFESLIGGSNAEITSKLTLARRPGLSVYNSQSFPAINSFYEFHKFSANSTSIRVMADTASIVYDATGPSTKTTVFTKSAGAGQTFFQGVGNTLYMGNGVDQKKWIQPPLSWAALRAFTVGQFIVDTNNNVQQVTTAGTSAASQPTWNAAIRGTTTDGSVTWTNRGSSAANWQEPAPTIAPSVGSASNAYWWTPGTIYVPGAGGYRIKDKNGYFQEMNPAGITTGSQYPNFSTQFGGTTTESTGGANTWTNRGLYQGWQANTAYLQNQCIIDTNGFVQQAQANLTSGAAQPAWNTTITGLTPDGGNNWKNLQYGAIVLNFGATWAYAHHTVTGGVTTASPSMSIQGPLIGQGLSLSIRTQGTNTGIVDAIWLFRTTDGGTTLLFDQSSPNTGAGNTFINETSANTDASLNPLIQAAINNANDPPPAAFINATYHLSRVWGSVGNAVYYSSASLATIGTNTENFPPANVFVFPSLVTRLLPTAVGLLVFTQSDLYLISGLGTSTSSLFSIPFLIGIGLQSYNALAVNGSTIYLMTTQKQTIALEPSSGVSEVGFPIGDTLETTFDPAQSYVTWHASGSRDKALYVADGSTGWYRMSPTPAPESGISWSTKATITGGCKAVESVETAPGVHNLLVGPASSGPILKRDLTVSTDNSTPFTWSAIIGSIVLAHPGQVAEVSFIGTDSTAIGTRPSIGVLMDEISGSFTNLSNRQADPPILAPSTTVYGDRYFMASAGIPAFCRHMQIQFSWPAEAAQNELLSYTIYGAHHNLN